ncbi:hypothetical protein N9129_01420 [Akkermansiaceae bacterium]|nr:hypothetical protein [Akkermansiaceae bacterium]
MKTTTLISALFALGFAASASAQQMNFQGRLTDNAGAPRPGPQATLTFSIWNAATGGGKEWGDFQINADLIDGRFSVKLGDAAGDDGNGNILAESFGGQRYIQIQVGTDAPLPRQEVLSSPTALSTINAENIRHNNRLLTFTDVGTFGTAATFDFGKPGILLETLSDGEAAGIQLNGDSINMYSPGDGNALLKIYDEDSLPGTVANPATPRFTVDGIGGVISNGNGDFAGNFDIDGFTQLDGFNSEGSGSVVGTLSVSSTLDANGNLDVDGFTTLDGFSSVGNSSVTGNLSVSGSITGIINGQSPPYTLSITATQTTFANPIFKRTIPDSVVRNYLADGDGGRIRIIATRASDGYVWTIDETISINATTGRGYCTQMGGSAEDFTLNGDPTIENIIPVPFGFIAIQDHDGSAFNAPSGTVFSDLRLQFIVKGNSVGVGGTVKLIFFDN